MARILLGQSPNITFRHWRNISPQCCHREVDGIAIECPSQTEIVLSGIDKEKIGQFAAMIRGVREPEPYHGYGIRYSDEVIDRKVGKAAGSKG